MYKVEWSKDNKNLPILNDFAQDNIIPPRPVFFEELDLLGFDKYFTYPKCEEPLLWAIGRDYYYESEKVARAVGGNIYNAPLLEIYQNGIGLKPINTEELIKINKNKIEVLKNEAIEFTKKIYKDYVNKVDFFIVAFSGGKDSQVLLDLVTIALEPEQYKVIFTDTTMELQPTYETVQKTEKHYKNIYKNFKITTVRNPIDAEEFWKTFGPPSRIIRWCCSVYKTAPVHNYLKSLNNGKHPKTILFDGVRRDESNNRANHLRIADEVKHNNVTNVRPIIEWNEFEIFLYLFYKKIELNSDYRSGSTRVGCSICPFASEWGDFMTYNKHKEVSDKFINVVKNYSKKIVNKNTSVDEYISKRLWKLRAGGNSIETDNSIEIFETKDQVEMNLVNSKENIFEWLKVLGDYKINSQVNNIDINVGGLIITITFTNKNNILELKTNERNISNLSHIKRVAYKTNYCIHCGSCEAECPTGALSVFPKVEVNSDLCIHCNKCLDFIDKGCIMTNSTKQSQKHVVGIGDYNNFGMRQEWLSSFLKKGIDWLNSGELGTKQVVSLKKWFRDSGIYNSKSNEITDFYILIKKISNDKTVYEILLIELFLNSKLLNWYLSSINWGEKIDKTKSIELLLDFTDTTETLADLVIRGLMNLFDTTPLGEELKIGLITKENNIRYIEKIGTDNVSNEAILYSLYKLKETKSRDNFRVSEFYDEGFEGGPYNIFGINKDVLTQKLRFISEETKLIDVDLNQGLDNIFLKDLSAIDVLKGVLKGV